MSLTETSERQPFLFIPGEPERLFRLGPVAEHDLVVSSSMPTGPWLEGSSGQINGGSLGVLADVVLGYAILLERPADHWSVSSEISIDLCHPITPGGRLLARARTVSVGSRGALSSGEVRDEDGRLVAICGQHGRFIPRPPTAESRRQTVDPVPAVAARPRSVYDLLGAEPSTTDRRAALDIVVTAAHANPLTNMHGGVTLCAAELTAIAALETNGGPMASTSIHVAYVRPIPMGTAMRFTAVVEHAGRTFAVAHVEARSADGRLCVRATITAAPR